MKNYQAPLNIEDQLESFLHPVLPPDDFISNLQERLKKQTIIAVERPDYLVLILLVLSGLVFGAILFWMIQSIVRIFRKGSR